MSIHKEGFATIFVTLFVSTILYLGVVWLFPENRIVQNIVLSICLIVFVIVLQFFRNPTRHIEQNPTHILAPADGKVVAIEEVFEGEFLQRNCRQISIFMSPFNVHINRNPISGEVSYFKYHKGKYLVAWHPKSSTENERTTIAVRTPEGKEVLFRQIAGALAKRIVWYVKEGEKVQQGDEFGFIKFGSRVDIFIPLEAKVAVKIGEKSVGGKTILATW
ncbi:phosphatidylserine decarboxylase family protein [Raineya orbicola]|jgi:phosphatidylserine decarboxylase|uniref:Phosphatidylserine decarboxylase proenzyme n=1 Tax=Raineya orbicola TaxID=2016530 RepID=A0A2N3I7B5_9BACT|nr:phosphatidylserine decarboxylase family protein [Raineya orbicola]PKQ66198.1 Phosphatidylserine decarboxylase -like protein [Raineya orbicola]